MGRRGRMPLEGRPVRIDIRCLMFGWADASPTRRAGACPHVDVSRERPSSDTAIVGVAYRRRLELGRRRAGPSRCLTGCVQARTAACSTGARTVRPRRAGPAGACVARQAPATRALFLDQPGRAGPDRDRRTRGRSRPVDVAGRPRSRAGLSRLPAVGVQGTEGPVLRTHAVGRQRQRENGEQATERRGHADVVGLLRRAAQPRSRACCRRGASSWSDGRRPGGGGGLR